MWHKINTLFANNLHSRSKIIRYEHKNFCVWMNVLILTHINKVIMKRFDDVIKGSTPSVVVFIHAGQQDVLSIRDNINDLRKKYGDKINVLRVDGSYNHLLARNFNLTTYPTYILIKEGQELMRESGDKTLTELSDMVDRAF